MFPLNILSGVSLKGKIIIFVLILMIGGGLWVWHNLEVSEAHDAGYAEAIDSVLAAPAEIVRDTVVVQLPGIEGKTKVQTVVRTERDTVIQYRTGVRTATTSFLSEAGEVSVSGNLTQSYDPTIESFGYKLAFDPIKKVETTVTKYLPIPCPEPSWFNLSMDVFVGSLFGDPAFDMGKKAYAFATTPRFGSGKFTVSIPVGIAMLPKMESLYSAQSETYTKQMRFKAGFAWALQLSLRLTGD